LSVGVPALARHRASRIRPSGIVSQASTSRRLQPTALRMTLAASPSRVAAAKMAVSLHVPDHGFDGRRARHSLRLMTPKMPRFWPEMNTRHNARLFSRCVLQRDPRWKKFDQRAPDRPPKLAHRADDSPVLGSR